jgi:RNA polymerase sigma factor (sigma-70 family)
LTYFSIKELVERLQKGDMEAFNTLYLKYHSALYSNILRLCRDEIVAEDLLQETFIALWEKRHLLDPNQEISGWLFVVSYNKSVSFLKIKLKESMAKSTSQQIDYGSDDRVEIVENQINVLKKGILLLSPQKRMVFDLCKLQRKTYEEAARELNISKHTVKEYLSDAMDFLKEFAKREPSNGLKNFLLLASLFKIQFL